MNGSPLRRRWSDDAGFTLIDVIVSIAILGAVGVSLLSGVTTNVLVSDQNRDNASIDIALKDYVEALKLTVAQRSGSGWCSSTAYTVIDPATGNVFAPPAGYTAPSQTLGPCPSAVPTVAQVQSVTVTEASMDGRVTDKVIVSVIPSCLSTTC